VAVRVAERLEVVDVDEHEADVLGVARRAGDLPLERGLEGAPVGDLVRPSVAASCCTCSSSPALRSASAA
jgi:hypothetical protein